VAQNKVIDQLRRSIQREKIDAKLAGTQPAGATIESWKNQIRLETLRDRLDVLEQTRRRWGADLTDPAARRKLSDAVADLERRAEELARKLG
jgi:hypothetical protein